MKLGYRLFLAGFALLFSNLAMSQDLKPIDGDKPIKQKVVSKRFEAKHMQPVKPLKQQMRIEIKEENIRKVN